MNPGPNAPGTKTMIFAGLPPITVNLTLLKEKGYRLIYFLSPDDAKKFSGPIPDAVFIWETDAALKAHFVDKCEEYLGAEIADVGDSARLAMLLGQAIELYNFDQGSMKVLNQKREPMRNAMRNWRWVEDGVPLRLLKNAGKNVGHAALIIAAGPSLNAQWQALAQIRATDPKLTVLVVGRSYAKAMGSGIKPDFVVEAEQYEFDQGIWNFAPVPTPDIVLACPLSVYPGVFKAWPAGRMVLVDHTTAAVHSMEKDIDSIDGGNSVAHLAFNLAGHLGCNPIVLAGVDLGYPDPTGDTHADGTFPEGWPNQVLNCEHTKQTYKEGIANDGFPIQSSPAYHNFGSLFERLLLTQRKANPDLKAYNLSRRGLKMLGFEYLDIKDWGKWNTSSTPPSSSEPALPGSSGSYSSVGASPTATASAST